MSVYDYVLHFLNRLIFSFLFPLDFAKSKDLKNKTWFLRCFDNGMLGIPAQHDKNRFLIKTSLSRDKIANERSECDFRLVAKRRK